MGETQIYSQRLHGITEKRRILSEVDRIQRELEQQRVKLQQLKRKSLRDRWLMDGLVPTAGAETDNPLSETEGQIKDLELQLESLQSDLVYLENPELKALKGVKVQGVTLQKELVNGERNLQHVDQNENLKKHSITEESDQPGNSHGEKPAVSQQTDHPGASRGEKPAVSQKDPKSSPEVGVEHPVPAPQSTNVSENHEVEHNLHLELSNSNEPDDKQTHPSQNAEGSVQKDEGGVHNSLNEEHEMQNSGQSPEHQDQRGEHHAHSGDPQELSLDGDTVDKVQSIPDQKLRSLENTFEQENQNLRSLPSELGSVSQKTGDLQPSSGKEDLNIDLFPQDQDGKESLLDEITKLVNFGDQGESNQQNQDGNKPRLSTEHLSPESLEVHINEGHSQNLEEHKVLVLISHEQGHTPDEEFALSLETERAQPVPGNTQTEAEEPVAVCMEIEPTDVLNQGSILHREDQTPDSAPSPLENSQSSVLPPSDQEVCTTLPCKDQVPSQSPLSGSQNQVDQVQIPQVLGAAASGHKQRSSNPPHDPSASHKPETKETSTAPESQPLLQKPQETDAHQGANTAETRDKSTPTKKKTCQCCVVM
ncbi:PREDICTED: paralemmin-3-like [Nanorana parkeri]|uniref:paralemmin-3-like n=1 Tax=Nanorana parkeri TaxID=125878 RepID=UPI0008541B97|nr:PREDICTED: paralemmin-3-like [Nanorana parkeri]